MEREHGYYGIESKKEKFTRWLKQPFAYVGYFVVFYSALFIAIYTNTIQVLLYLCLGRRIDHTICGMYGHDNSSMQGFLYFVDWGIALSSLAFVILAYTEGIRLIRLEIHFASILGKVLLLTAVIFTFWSLTGVSEKMTHTNYPIGRYFEKG